MNRLPLLSVALLLFAMSPLHAEQWGLESGTPQLKSAGPLAFGPDNILFVGDPMGAAVYAIEISGGDGKAKDSLNIDDLAAKLFKAVGGKATVNDMAVHPKSGVVVISAAVEGKPVLVRIDAPETIRVISLEGVPFSEAKLADAPEDKVVQRGRRTSNPRSDSITDVAWFEGKVLISGLRDGAAPSSVREISFPFGKADRGVGIQIFHAAHNREEDYAALRTFVPLMIDGEPNLLAAYVCTPLVKIPLKELETAKGKLNATTVAELGNRNRPLDMISYKKGGEEYLLLSNSARGVMKITTKGLKENAGLSEPVKGGGTAGQNYETIESLQGVVQMDKLGESHAVVLLDSDGSMSLKTVELP